MTSKAKNEKKTMYPTDTIKESQLFNSGAVHVAVYTTTPQYTIAIMAELTEEQGNDVQNAIDKVLKFHGK